jgi:hypothetical protein
VSDAAGGGSDAMIAQESAAAAIAHGVAVMSAFLLNRFGIALTPALD